MASSSSNSSIRKSFKYDVFLSFRGEDTRKNFVDHLYSALQQKSIHTYKDDERIEKGKTINDQLIKSIEDSNFCIIVFSKNYASSSWCLDELVKIMECQKTTDQTAYPVFYDVEPTEVRKQSGAVGEALAKHNDAEAAQKWREALKEAADLAGWELKNTTNGHEAKFIQKIVEQISLDLRSINFSTDEKLVGMETRVKGVVTYLETSVDDVRMIGIKGIGGGGKTTLARAVFDQISIQFEGKSFVENVREISKGSLYGLKSLQKQVLSDVLNDPNIIVSNVYDGKNMMKRMLCGTKVLVVLDDVDQIDQLEALVGQPNWYKSGSRIIITTRDEQVLITHGVNLIRDVNLLSLEEAICLFSRYAFGREVPIQGYEELSREVIHYASGLPLTIRVLGSFLCGKNELEWLDSLSRLKKIPLKETLEKLELSYIGLEEDYKEIFLDIACMLKGWKKEKAVRALESCGFHARIGLRVLEQKSLITISKLGYLDMHDHIEEMGKNIVRRLHPDDPNKHSRLWIDEEIENILANNLGTKATNCIKLRTVDQRWEIIMKGLRKMKKLRYLYVSSSEDVHCSHRKWNFDEGSQYFPKALRYVDWFGYPLRSLPKTFQINNLVSLRMPNSRIAQLWEGGETKVFPKLAILDLHHSRLRTLDLGLTPNLESLCLKRCYDLVEVSIRVECLKLVSLDLNRTKLRSLDLSLTPNLENLNLDDCNELVEIHMPAASLKLTQVNLSSSKLRSLKLGQVPNIETLSLRSCYDLCELHMPEGCPKLRFLYLSGSKLSTLDMGLTPDLERLDLKECSGLVEIHMPAASLKLTHVCISNSKLRSLKLGRVPNIEKLSLRDCKDLCELHMPEGCPKLRFLHLNGSRLSTLDMGLTPDLERLDLKECSSLVELLVPSGCLKKLVYLDLSGCCRFRSFLFDNLKQPKIVSLPELDLIAESTDVCPLHRDNNLPKFRFRCVYSEYQPLETGNLKKLISIGLCACTNLGVFSNSICSLRFLRKLKLEGSIPDAPKDLDQLAGLEEVTLCLTCIKYLPDSICMLKHLKSLELKSCLLLEKLPKDLGQLISLETLIITNCKLLRDIPSSICNIECLRYFYLPGCVRVEKLPEELGRLKCLKELNIEGTSIHRLPFSIFLLEGLCIIGSTWRLRSFGFRTSVIQDSIEGSTELAFCYI